MIPANEVSKYQATLRALREAGDGLVDLVTSVLEDNGYSTKHDAITAWHKAQGV